MGLYDTPEHPKMYQLGPLIGIGIIIIWGSLVVFLLKQVLMNQVVFKSFVTYKYDQKLCNHSNYYLEGSLVAKFLNGTVNH